MGSVSSLCVFAYHEVQQESTGLSPLELLYGRDVRGPLNVLKEERIDKSLDDVITYMDKVWNWPETAMEAVQDSMDKVQRREKE